VASTPLKCYQRWAEYKLESQRMSTTSLHLQLTENPGANCNLCPSDSVMCLQKHTQHRVIAAFHIY